MSDEDLADCYRKGDTAAGELLHKRLEQETLEFLRKKGPHRNEADWWNNKVWFKALCAVRSGRYCAHKGKFIRWIRKIAKRVIIDWYRKWYRERKGRAAWPVEMKELPSRDLGPATQDISRLDVWDCLERLSPKERAILVLTDMLGYKHREVADMLNLPLGTVGRTKIEAREKLRRCLEGKGW
jgi:RNA polymerase sigma factor (sigma-70 family)